MRFSNQFRCSENHAVGVMMSSRVGQFEAGAPHLHA